MEKICDVCGKKFIAIGNKKRCSKECIIIKGREKNRRWAVINKEKIKEYYKKYRLENKEKIKEHRKKYNLESKEKIKEKIKEKFKEHRRKYYLENKEKFKEKFKEHYLKNKERIKVYQRKYHNENYKDKFRVYLKNYKSKKRKNDVNFKLIENLRNRIRYIIKFEPKQSKTLEYLGCSAGQLREHLKKQFITGMTLDNYGRGIGKWSIDHVIPCEVFGIYKEKNLEKREEKLKKCFHYTNLQPLWFDENVRKSDKII